MSKKRQPRAKSTRSERREAERARTKLTEARLKLARLEIGGSAERPIEVASASVVEPHASGLDCAACGERARVSEHAARTIPDKDGVPRPLRVVHVQCPRCGVERDVYFRIVAALPS